MGATVTECNSHVKIQIASSSVLPKPTSSSSDVVHLTDNFVLRRMKELHTCGQSNKMLRLRVRVGSCAGFLHYDFSLDQKNNSGDRVFEKDKVKLLVDRVSFDLVKGATIDYVNGFVVKNPNAVGGKSSFTV